MDISFNEQPVFLGSQDQPWDINISVRSIEYIKMKIFKKLTPEDDVDRL